LQLEILLRAPGRITLAPARPRLLVRKTFRFGLVQGVILDQDPLTP
jgi:hypothetical protein